MNELFSTIFILKPPQSIAPEINLNAHIRQVEFQKLNRNTFNYIAKKLYKLESLQGVMQKAC